MFLTIILAVITGCVGCFFAIQIFSGYFKSYKLLAKLPGPKATPILGNIPDILCDDETLFRKVRQWNKTYAPIYKMGLTCFYTSVNISGAEEFETIAASIKNMKKGRVYNFLSRWLGEGLLTSTGTKWKTRRKILTPAFHFSILQQFVAVFNSETDILVGVLKNETVESSTNVVPLISKFTLFTLAETSMGTKLSLKSEEDKQYVNAINAIGKNLLQRIRKPWSYIACIHYNSSLGHQELKLVNILHNFTNNIISKKAENFEKFVLDENDYNYSKNKKLAFLDLLLNAKMSEGSIDDDGIRDEVNTFMFEGFDTTSVSICFTLMLLANYKIWQELAYQEITQILGNLSKDPSINDLNKMKTLERIIKESLRLYPSVPFISRTLEEDTIVNGYVLPKGVPINIHIYDLHRNPKYWMDSEKFDPNRFLPDNCVNRHPFAYVPFSAGPRNCIGQKFAMLELKAVLCGILRNFVLEPVDTPDTVKLVSHLVLRTKNISLEVKFRTRHS